MTQEKGAILPIEILQQVSSPEESNRRESIFQLEEQMKEHEQVEIPPTHRFINGMYMREITIPKGTLLTGRIHKFDHFDVMLSGDISVSSDDGTVKRLTGINIMEGKAGKKRAGYAHEDTRWITVHASPVRDGDEMYEFLTVGTFEELEDFHTSLSQHDYQIMLSEINMTEEQVRAQVESTDDICDVEIPSLGEVRPSKIEGLGYFAVEDIVPGEVISLARVEDQRTEAGRFTNHAFYPNAQMVVMPDGDVQMTAIKGISKDEEITVNYRHVINHRALEGDLCQP